MKCWMLLLLLQYKTVVSLCPLSSFPFSKLPICLFLHLPARSSHLPYSLSLTIFLFLDFSCSLFNLLSSQWLGVGRRVLWCTPSPPHCPLLSLVCWDVPTPQPLISLFNPMTIVQRCIWIWNCAMYSSLKFVFEIFSCPSFGSLGWQFHARKVPVFPQKLFPVVKVWFCPTMQDEHSYRGPIKNSIIH